MKFQGNMLRMFIIACILIVQLVCSLLRVFFNFEFIYFEFLK